MAISQLNGTIIATIPVGLCQFAICRDSIIDKRYYISDWAGGRGVGEHGTILIKCLNDITAQRVACKEHIGPYILDQIMET